MDNGPSYKSNTPRLITQGLMRVASKEALSPDFREIIREKDDTINQLSIQITEVFLDSKGV